MPNPVYFLLITSVQVLYYVWNIRTNVKSGSGDTYPVQLLVPFEGNFVPINHC